jgi:HPt (histidine-containing phosphotransfer) domain-containing protein
MAQVAHAFSGSAVSMGARRLSSLCKELELRCKTGDTAGLAGMVDDIEREYHRISAKLIAMMKP